MNALILIIFFAVIPIVAGLMLAALLQRGAKLPGVGFFRTVLFLPQVISPVVLGIIWVAIYAPGGAWTGCSVSSPTPWRRRRGWADSTPR